MHSLLITISMKLTKPKLTDVIAYAKTFANVLII